MNRRILFQQGLGMALGSLLCSPALAQDRYPNKPIRWIIPFAAGGPSDLLARLIEPKLGEVLGQPVLIENRAGASGNIGAKAVADAAPDGYLVVQVPTSFAANAAVTDKLPFDSIKSFKPVGRISTAPYIVLVSPALSVKTLAELIALGKQKPGTLTYGSGGTGSASHITPAGFTSQAGFEALHVAYKGLGPALVDLAGGQVNFVFSPIVSALPYLQSGKVRAIAISSAQRSAQLPDLPTIAETIPGFSWVSWDGLLAPAGTPDAVVDRLNAAIGQAMADPKITQALKERSLESGTGTPAEFGAFYAAEIERFRQTVKSQNIKID